MKPDKLSVHDLFQKERRYTVPLYQRAYVWSKEGQWEALWDDIERQAEACLAAPNLVSQRAHFLGAIVLNVSKIVGAGVARSEVIDGQQRLTTLQLLLAALRDFAVTNGSELATRFKRLTVNEDERPGSEASFKVWPTNADRTVFTKIQTAGSPDALLRALNTPAAHAPRMAAAYLFFYQAITDFVGTSNGDRVATDQRLLGLLQALRSALQLVVIELEAEDDPQVIFETLNARGQPLLPSDLIRNYIFLHAEHEITADSDELYERYWKPFDTVQMDEPQRGELRFWHAEERQGRLTRPRVDLFLFHYLSMKTERELNIGQLFGEFRRWHAESGLSATELLADLRAYGDIFEQLIRPVGDDRISFLARRLRALDNSNVYPILMWLRALSPERLSAHSRDQIVANIESWLVRRFMCWLTNKNYNRFFVSLLAKMKRASVEIDLADVVRAELTRSGDATTAWPTDAAFRKAWLDKPLYAKSRPDRSVMVLSAIERQQRTARNEPNPIPLKLSVEHLLPQRGLLVDYPFDPVLALPGDETLAQRRDRLIHTVGNLTLLTSELNASASNGAFPAKVAKIVDDSDLRLNAWLRSTPQTQWNEGSIVERGELLFSAALMLWPRPEGEPENIGDDEEETPGTTAGSVVTDEASLNAKRVELTARLAARDGVSLRSLGVAKVQSGDGGVGAVMAISKRYEDRGSYPYWYAFRPSWLEYIGERERGYFMLGCMDRDDAYALPYAVMRDHVNALNSTTNKATGRLHWHVHLSERPGGLVLLLPKRQSELDISPYKLPRLGQPGCSSEPISQLAEGLEPASA